MNKKLTTTISIVIIILAGFTTLEITTGYLEDSIFNLIPYNYTSHVWIPSNNNEGSLGGYYNIQGQGKNFNFFIKLPGASESESPLDYIEDGLTGTGKIKNIKITLNTLNALFSGDFKKAIFETEFSGDFDMKCAAWTGYGNFSSNGKSIPGKFIIKGPLTYWEGTFNVQNESNRIILNMDFIYHPQNNPNIAKHAIKTVYM
jgi:hypothetical protein